MTELKNKIKEAVSSVSPITCVVFLLSITITPMPISTMLPFTCSVVMLIIDMGPFSLGADMFVMLVGESIGTILSTSEKGCLMVCITFVIDFTTTIVGLDLVVLARQAPGIPDSTLIWTVVAGVGFFLVMALLRILFHWNLKYLLMLFCALVFILACFSMNIFMAVALDSGGVVTGLVMVPFLMALDIDMANVAQKHAKEESFGIIALCGTGPVLAVLLLDILYESQGAMHTPFEMAYVEINKGVIRTLLTELPHYIWEVSEAPLPILCFFLLLQLTSNYFNKRVIIRTLVGTLHTFLGPILFLCGANVDLVPADYFIGTQIVTLSYNWILIPIGVLIGFFVVKAEPTVHVLTRQVEDILSSTISTKAMLYSLSVGVSISLGIVVLCILSCTNIMVFLVPEYLTVTILSFSVPNVFTGITSDSGSVTSGPMTATFLLSFATGAYKQLRGNALLDVFGIIAMVVMTPLLTIQILDLAMIKHKKTAVGELQEDSTMEFKEVINERTED